jgi:hypothetical protein
MRYFLNHFIVGLLACVWVQVGVAQEVVFNEVMSSNQKYIFDSDGDTPDWFELYNKSNEIVNLSEYSVYDKLNSDSAWKFPNYSLAKRQYLLVFASGKDRKELPLFWTTIITLGDTWRYLVPNSEPSSTWKTASFDDSGWKQGKSGFGYGDNDDNTLLSGAMSVFIRKSFTITNAEQVEAAFLHIDYDDAFVAYLNGTEIARANITTTGAPAYNAVADNSDHEARMYTGGLPEKFAIANIHSLLVNGSNVLAIQIHNAATSSTDLSAIPFLSLGCSAPIGGELASFIDVPQIKFHTNFNVASKGENLYLFKNGTLVDSVKIPELPNNISYGRNANSENNWFYFNEPTPEKINNSTPFSSTAGEVNFSVVGGIYSKAFSVELTSNNPGDKIYYTKDASEPTVSDLFYSGPITISSTTMLRAKVINTQGMQGFVYTQSYFFGVSHDIPIISLVTEPDNFFGYDEGIYATGSPKPSSGENCDNGANYWQDWERPVHVSMIMPDGKLAFEQNGGVKIFGGCSRNFAQKSLSLRFRKQYGKDGLNYKVFDDLDIDMFYSLNLRNSGNDWNNTMFRDGLQTHLFPKCVDKTAFRPAVVYINGEYWGIHNIRERIDQYYVATHHNLDPSSINIMEFHVNWLLNQVEGDGQNYLDMLDFIEKNNLAITENFEYIKTQMDVENFALYQAANICIRNTDWPGNNVKFWQSYDSDGKWRWITFDTDFGFSDVNHNTLTFALAETGDSWPNPAISTYLLRQLNKNQEFKYLFINAFADELNTLWKTSDIYTLIDKMKGDISNEIPAHFKRWGASPNTWANNVNSLYTFASQRPAVVRQFVQNYYNLSGTCNFNLAVSDAKHGSIKLNTIQSEKYPWSGIYFNNVPVSLIAKPKRGYRFVRWEGDIKSTQDTIRLTRNQSTSIKAVFEKDGTYADIVLINEVFYKNIDGETPQDWIELYNNSINAVDLSGWLLKDNDDNHQFYFPQGTIINANDYLAVCSNEALFSSFYHITKNTTGDLGFGLSNTTDCIRLYDRQKILIDSLWYFNPDRGSSTAFSYLRIDDGEMINWYCTDGFGTPLSKNIKGTFSSLPRLNLISKSDVMIYPNPFSDHMTISFKLAKRGNVSISLISQNGMLIEQIEDIAFEPGEYSVKWNNRKQIPQGIYILIIKTEEYVRSKKVIRL